MAGPETPKAGPAYPPKGAPPAPSVLFPFLIFGFGAAAGVLLAFTGAGFVEDSGGLVVTVFLSALLVVAGLGGLIFAFRRPILRRLFGYADTQVELFADPLSRVATGTLARDAEAATAAARDLVALGLARYSWLAARRWVIASLTALIGQATEDAAARFRAEAPDLAAAQDPYDGMVNVLDPLTDLDRALVLRIVSASRAARPYRFLDQGLRPDDPDDKLRVALDRRRNDLPAAWSRLSDARGWGTAGAETDQLTDRPASPERGQLLDVLLAGGVRNLEVLNHFGLDLSFAYLQDATVILMTGQGARLAYADLSGSHLRSVDLGGSAMENARLDRTVIRDSDFSVVDAARLRPPFPSSIAPLSSALDGASFGDAAIFDTSFRGARMLAADFDGALLFRPDFTGAVLSAATLRGTMLVAPVMAGADLRSVDMDGAIVFGADALDRMTADAAPGSFRADRYRMDPVDITDEQAHRVAWAQSSPDDIAAATGAQPAFRLVRIKPLED